MDSTNATLRLPLTSTEPLERTSEPPGRTTEPSDLPSTDPLSEPPRTPEQSPPRERPPRAKLQQRASDVRRSNVEERCWTLNPRLSQPAVLVETTDPHGKDSHVSLWTVGSVTSGMRPYKQRHSQPSISSATQPQPRPVPPGTDLTFVLGHAESRRETRRRERLWSSHYCTRHLKVSPTSDADQLVKEVELAPPQELQASRSLGLPPCDDPETWRTSFSAPTHPKPDDLEAEESEPEEEYRLRVTASPNRFNAGIESGFDDKPDQSVPGWEGSANGKAVSVDSLQLFPPRIDPYELPCFFAEQPKRILLVKRIHTEEISGVAAALAIWLHTKWDCTVYVEPNALRDFEALGVKDLVVWDSDAAREEDGIDLAVTLGGDGTTLWTSGLFSDIVPPILSVTMGSLSYLSQFTVDEIVDVLEYILSCQVFRFSLRSRLYVCLVDEDEVPLCTAHCVNECVIDRGPLGSMVMLDVCVDGNPFTTVSADGLILATPTGSTAYSMSAGGSMVHPSVPCILFTPICPHSLSMRPLILPDSATLRLTVPSDARNSLWLSIDSRVRREVKKGQSIIVRLSPYPLPLVCKSTTECGDGWLQNLKDNLNWNQRIRQKRMSAASPYPDRRGSPLDYILPTELRRYVEKIFTPRSPQSPTNVAIDRQPERSRNTSSERSHEADDNGRQEEQSERLASERLAKPAQDPVRAATPAPTAPSRLLQPTRSEDRSSAMVKKTTTSFWTEDFHGRVAPGVGVAPGMTMMANTGVPSGTPMGALLRGSGGAAIGVISNAGVISNGGISEGPRADKLDSSRAELDEGPQPPGDSEAKSEGTKQPRLTRSASHGTVPPTALYVSPLGLPHGKQRLAYVEMDGYEERDRWDSLFYGQTNDVSGRPSFGKSTCPEENGGSEKRKKKGVAIHPVNRVDRRARHQ